MANILNQSQIDSIVKIALQAGEIAMSYFGGNHLNVKKKIDDSPLTIADSLISELIYHQLQNIAPAIPVICEEGKNRDFGNGIFWLVDPIDGTNSFVNNDPEFTINIALVNDQRPIFGLIFAPAIAEKPLYYTNADGHLMKYFVDSKKEEIFFTKKRNNNDFVIIASKRSSDKDIYQSYLNLKQDRFDMFGVLKINQKTKFYKVSSSLKFVYLIEGKANLYLHLRRSMEWDIAAGQALLTAVGGRITNFGGGDILYQKIDLINQPFVATISKLIDTA